MAKQRFTIKQVVAVLEETHGMVYVAARKLRCSANTIYNYAARYAAVQEVIDQERGMMVDTAEIALYSSLQNKEAWAVSLVLKTLGKERGFVERQELSGVNGKPIEMNVTDARDKLNDLVSRRVARTREDEDPQQSE